MIEQGAYSYIETWMNKIWFNKKSEEEEKAKEESNYAYQQVI